MQAAIIIKNANVILGKSFSALSDVTVNLPEGKIIGFIGPSGAGKTTLIRCIVGRQKLQSGAITIFGLPAGDKKLRKSVSYMTQEVSVYNDLSVRENLQYFATMAGISRKNIEAEVARVITAVDMHSQIDRIVDSLSGGQKQRVSLAIALLGSPKLLVLDEPTVGLDPVLREQLWDLFRAVAKQGTTLIISSHVMDEAERCDELLLIRSGRILSSGTPKELCDYTGTSSVEASFLKLVGENT